MAWLSPQLPGDTSLDVLIRARAPSPPWSPVKVPSLHDTDMWGVLLFQARPQPTGWATPIAVAITGREAGGQLLLQDPCSGKGNCPLVCQPPPVLGREGREER